MSTRKKTAEENVYTGLHCHVLEGIGLQISLSCPADVMLYALFAYVSLWTDYYDYDSHIGTMMITIIVVVCIVRIMLMIVIVILILTAVAHS